MREIEMSADEVVSALLGLGEQDIVCILDSCGVGHLGSHLMIAGVAPLSVTEMSGEDPELIVEHLTSLMTGECAVFFSMSYALGARLQGIELRPHTNASDEPGLFAACFRTLIIHDYDRGTTSIADGPSGIEFEKRLRSAKSIDTPPRSNAIARSNFTHDAYLASVEAVKERIRVGYTYQTNITQQFTVEMPEGDSPQAVFRRLRVQHPAPFAAYFKRHDSTVVSASPERFFKIENGKITASPIKGTRPRTGNAAIDEIAKSELLASSKDIAENTMIVDLLRNDLGRVCKFGSVHVEKLCELEEHPTLYHLVSTISGELADGVTIADVVKALFPCGSITGAPKISTMRIIDELEPAGRGLSMGTIGYYLPGGRFGLSETLDTSVAIRTMVIRDGVAEFNVGGGIVIDSDPEGEYRESLNKAEALLRALHAEFQA